MKDLEKKTFLKTIVEVNYQFLLPRKIRKRINSCNIYILYRVTLTYFYWIKTYAQYKYKRYLGCILSLKFIYSVNHQDDFIYT